MSEINKIEKIFTVNSNETIPKQQVNKWIESKNIEVLGATVELIMDSKYYTRIIPELTFEDYYPFIFDYYVKCMQNDYEGEWCHSRYLAAYELKSFIESLWDDKQIAKETRSKIRKDIKSKLSDLCSKADFKLKDVLINGLLEHLFDIKSIKSYFNNWQKHDILNIYYECAINKSKSIK